MAKTQTKWEGSGTKLPSGHTIIETHESGESRWAIFDQSGRTPESSDDGVLWLDPTRCLNAQTRHRPTVPVVNNDGEQFTTPIDTPTLLMLSRMFNWTIEGHSDHFYNVR